MRYLVRTGAILSVSAALSCGSSTHPEVDLGSQLQSDSQPAATAPDGSANDGGKEDVRRDVGGAAVGGAVGTGGAIGTGGKVGTGGTPGSGGLGKDAGPGSGGRGGRDGTGGAGKDGGPGSGGIGKDGGPGIDGASNGGRPGTGGATGTGGVIGTGGAIGTGGSTSTTAPATLPQGWLYTSGNKIYVSDGSGAGAQWMGRGVNIDDLFLCGYNSDLSMTSPSAEDALKSIVSSVVTDWKANFFRTSLGMNSYTAVSWIGTSTYKTAMTDVINAVGSYPGVYVLVTLRSDKTTVNSDGSACGQGDDAVCLPSSATDDVYRALVSSFANAPYVMFAVANEPGGMSSEDSELAKVMEHVVGVIRAEEDSLAVPHHIVAVQGNQWTSKIGFYNSSPLSEDNVVYEYHSYPPEATGTYGYTQSKIPVIIGEYGPEGSDTSFASSFFADVETKQIPNLAWSVSPYSNCAPDLVSVTRNTTLTPNTWGKLVKDYLTAH